MDTLYHYTTIDALLNMVKTDSQLHFWATRYDYLNDGEEFKKGIEVLNSIIPKIEKEFNTEEAKKISGYITELGNKLEKYYKSGNAGFYVVSLSEEADSLPMWRMYGNDCNGIAIGLDFDTVYHEYDKTEIAGKEKFREVSYEGDKNIEHTIKSIYELWKTLEVQEGMELANEYANIVNLLCIYIKSHHFAYEKEWRVALYDWDIKPDNIDEKYYSPIRFRNKNGIIIPYKEISLTTNAIKSITLGPGYDLNRSEASLKMFLKSKNIDTDKVKITQSNVPYYP